MCKHNKTDWQYQSDGDTRFLMCHDCGKSIAWDCDACNGTGWVNSAEYNADWVNYPDDEDELCPLCGGMGIEYTISPEDAREFWLSLVYQGQWTQAEVARKLKVSPSTVGRWMKKDYGDDWKMKSVKLITGFEVVGQIGDSHYSLKVGEISVSIER